VNATLGSAYILSKGKYRLDKAGKTEKEAQKNYFKGLGVSADVLFENSRQSKGCHPASKNTERC